MSKHYKNLILLLIPFPVFFCLALSLGSAGESSELCHLCRNKALVKEAILAFDEDPYDANLPEHFDPNYVQYGPDIPSGQTPKPHFSGEIIDGGFIHEPVTFESIIAEGDMVAVRLSWSYFDLGSRSFFVSDYEIAIYRIAGGKIVEGHTYGPSWYGYD